MQILKKLLKILYLSFWTFSMLLIVVSVVISEMKFHQKIVYIMLTLISFIAVVDIFKSKKND